MSRAKRKLPTPRGWRVGGAAEFLGLSAEESRFIELKLALRRRKRSEAARPDHLNLIPTTLFLFRRFLRYFSSM